VPNQEKVINRVRTVTYNDTRPKMRLILLPNREPMQDYFTHMFYNPFYTWAKQEWEFRKFQNGTVLELSRPFPRIQFIGSQEFLQGN
jgi:hypothetical protein